MCIINSGESAVLKLENLNQRSVLYDRLETSIRYFSYTNRYV